MYLFCTAKLLFSQDSQLVAMRRMFDRAREVESTRVDGKSMKRHLGILVARVDAVRRLDVQREHGQVGLLTFHVMRVTDERECFSAARHGHH